MNHLAVLQLAPILAHKKIVANHHVDVLSLYQQNNQYFLKVDEKNTPLQNHEIIKVGHHYYEINIQGNPASLEKPIELEDIWGDAFTQSPNHNLTPLLGKLPLPSEPSHFDKLLPQQSSNHWYHEQQVSLNSYFHNEINTNTQTNTSNHSLPTLLEAKNTLIDPLSAPHLIPHDFAPTPIVIHSTDHEQLPSTYSEGNILKDLGISPDAAILPKLTEPTRQLSYNESSPLDNIDELLLEEQSHDITPFCLSNHSTLKTNANKIEPNNPFFSKLKKITHAIWN
ncbi:MAG: hypothetical protein A3F17_02730 [Gammaproteobacteria bacterium RIFCSPHIGHO2_12_FULL_41_15]|nr:MAG: hypothetical protein A3F17_02730 [Gammaproteobacteria bacterium RIFCSPHIGHO2_12_FULL_41_15]